MAFAQPSLAQLAPVYENEIFFSGRWWGIKDHQEPMGPGDNLFGQHPRNVVVNKKGELQLSIHKTKQGWSCAEVASNDYVNDGVYEFQINSDITKLNPSMVLGLFLYSNDNPPFYNEVDIEFSQWADPSNDNAQFVVHQSGGVQKSRFELPKGATQSTHRIEVTANSIAFYSYWKVKNQRHEVNEFSCIMSRPKSLTSKNMRIRMNLWLNNKDDGVGHCSKVTISKVTYTPATQM